MKHASEEELILYRYGELPARNLVGAHIESCEQCRHELAALLSTLSAVDTLEVPERGESYPREIVRSVLAVEERKPLGEWRRWWAPGRLAWVGATAMLVVLAFLAGRVDRGPEPVPEAVRERILLVAVGEHLERSERLLVELVNSKGTPSFDVSDQQGRARRLVDENRIYRSTARRSGDVGITDLLDRLERVLVEISNGPSSLAYAELADLRRRIEDRGLLLRIRVLARETQDRARVVPRNDEI